MNTKKGTSSIIKSFGEKIKAFNDKITVKRLVIIGAAVVVMSVILGVATRLSYTNYLSENPNVDDYTVCYMYSDIEEDFDSVVLGTAKFVAKVKVISEGEPFNSTTFFKAKVEDVYVGDKSLVNQEIGLFHDVYFGVLDDKLYYFNRHGPFNLMQPDKEYYVALYDKEFIEGLKEKLGVKYTFRAAPDDYSIIPVDLGERHWFGSKSLTYKDVRDYPYICDTEESAKSIEKNVKKFLKFFNIKE